MATWAGQLASDKFTLFVAFAVFVVCVRTSQDWKLEPVLKLKDEKTGKTIIGREE